MTVDRIVAFDHNPEYKIYVGRNREQKCIDFVWLFHYHPFVIPSSIHDFSRP